MISSSNGHIAFEVSEGVPSAIQFHLVASPATECRPLGSVWFSWSVTFPLNLKGDINLTKAGHAFRQKESPDLGRLSNIEFKECVPREQQGKFPVKNQISEHKLIFCSFTVISLWKIKFCQNLRTISTCFFLLTSPKSVLFGFLCNQI